MESLCTQTRMTLSIVFASAVSILIISVFIVAYHAFTHRKEETMLPISRKCSVIFIFCTWMALSSSIIVFSGTCLNIVTTEVHQIAILLYYLTFGMASFILIIIFFHRIVRVFKKTPFQLKKITIRIYNISFILLPSWLFAGIALGWIICKSECILVGIVASLFLLFYILLLISLVSLFIYKLIQVYNNEQDDNGTLVAAITKLAVLVSLSVFVTFTNMITTVFYFQYERVWIEWLSIFVAIADLYTNFICVIMCFKAFKSHYDLLCHGLDSICKICWNKIVNCNDARILMIMQKDNQNKRDTTINSETSKTNTDIQCEL